MNSDAISAFIKTIKGKGVLEVKVKGNKDKQPKKYSYNDARKSYMPEVTAVYEKKTDFYAIEKKITKDILPDLIAKWILFSMEARRLNGVFYLVVDESNASKCQAIIDRKQLAIELIKI
jgi:hypothetical protein